MAHTAGTTEQLVTVEEFDRMWDSGIIGPEDRVELIEGRLVRREPVNAPHASILLRMMHKLTRTLGDLAMVTPQLPIVASERSKPFPDIALVRPRDDYYAAKLPVPDDVLAVIEVSHSRLRYDRGEKLRLYARVGVADYWIVDVKKKRIELYRERHDLGYGSVTVAEKGGTVAFSAFPNIVFSVNELVG
ncbi:MAG TPA: Uma2 family endonuclease [Dongiaceae bacterium]|nr:Uma2 family endonuclease [Dongiaceae bacterium]